LSAFSIQKLEILPVMVPGTVSDAYGNEETYH
jgi:hypothetical protein